LAIFYNFGRRLCNPWDNSTPKTMLGYG